MPDPSKIIRVDPVRPDPLIIRKAADALIRNETVIFPTQCLYGIAANALDPQAVEQVFAIKQRPADNPILVLIADRKDLDSLAASVPQIACRLMDRFWPGSLTLVFDAAAHLPAQLTAGTGKIGVRLARHPVARALAHAVPFPITGTSANLSGQPGCTHPAHLPQEILAKTSLVLDSGPLKGGTGSTIVDVTCSPATILRQGAVSARDINETIC